MSNPKETIIYIYSSYSKCCNQVQSRVVELAQKLPILVLNIDNRHIRKCMLRCKRIKVSRVPCLLIINGTENKVELYEGDNFLNAFETLYNVFVVQPQLEEAKRLQEEQIKQQMQQQSIPQQMDNMHQQSNNLNDSLPPEMQYVPPTKKAENKKTPLNLILDQENQNVKSSEDEYKPPVKKSFGRTRYINDENLMPFGEDGIVAGSNVERPNRGEGHTGMAQSSLPDIGLTQEYTTSKRDIRANAEPISIDNKSPIDIDEETDEMMYDREIAPPPANTIKTKAGMDPLQSVKKVPFKINGKTEMITDLSEALDESDSLFTSKEDVNIEEMRGGPPKNDVKTQKMSAAKVAAEQMMKERQSMN